MVSTYLTSISQIGSFPQLGVKIKHIWNHHLVFATLMHFFGPPPKKNTWPSVKHLWEALPAQAAFDGRQGVVVLSQGFQQCIGWTKMASRWLRFLGGGNPNFILGTPYNGCRNIIHMYIYIYTNAPAIRLMSLMGTPYNGLFISLIWAGTLKIRPLFKKNKGHLEPSGIFCMYIYI